MDISGSKSSHILFISERPVPGAQISKKACRYVNIVLYIYKASYVYIVSVRPDPGGQISKKCNTYVQISQFKKFNNSKIGNSLTAKWNGSRHSSSPKQPCSKPLIFCQPRCWGTGSWQISTMSCTYANISIYIYKASHIFRYLCFSVRPDPGGQISKKLYRYVKISHSDIYDLWIGTPRPRLASVAILLARLLLITIWWHTPGGSKHIKIIWCIWMSSFMLFMWYDPLSQSIQLTSLPIWPCHSLSKMVVKKNCHRLRPFSLERRRRQWECADFNSYYESLCSASSFCLVRTDIFVVLLFKFFFLVLSDRFLVQLDLCVLDISKPPSHANRKKSAAAKQQLEIHWQYLWKQQREGSI